MGNAQIHSVIQENYNRDIRKKVSSVLIHVVSRWPVELTVSGVNGLKVIDLEKPMWIEPKVAEIYVLKQYCVNLSWLSSLLIVVSLVLVAWGRNYMLEYADRSVFMEVSCLYCLRELLENGEAISLILLVGK